jgi:hypothetical protein
MYTVRVRLSCLLFLTGAVGCATAAAPSDGGGGVAPPPPDLAERSVRPDAAPYKDAAVPVDAAQPCALGTPDHCGTCGTRCPPGADNAGTQRSCSLATAFGICDYVCLGEYYDVDGKASNGCEAYDGPPQDSALTAVEIMLPDAYTPNQDLGTMTNPANFGAHTYGDARVHAASPTTRPNGRDHW